VQRRAAIERTRLRRLCAQPTTNQEGNVPKKKTNVALVEPAAFSPYEDEWDGDLDKLHGFEEQIASDDDPELADKLFGADCRAAFAAGWVLGYTFPPEWTAAATRDELIASEPSSWGPISLYGKDMNARRIYFLELMAWAIHRVETFHTRSEATEFSKELKETREAVWGAHPWRAAARSATAYLDHVRAMADVFAHAPSAEEALYPNREHQPLA
jgi:hypothetical protein